MIIVEKTYHADGDHGHDNETLGELHLDDLLRSVLRSDLFVYVFIVKNICLRAKTLLARKK